MKTLLLQSANFKRDYVATLAIVLFLSIVVSEIALAIAIPAYLHHENAMALEVRRLKMLESFDGARQRCNGLKPKNGSAAEMELRLVSWNLDLLADYMRVERKNLTSDEIARIHAAVANCHAVLDAITNKSSFSHEKIFDTGKYVNSLIPKKP